MNIEHMIQVARALAIRRTPWRHNHRDPVLGLDCLNLLIYLIEEQTETRITLTPYSMTPNGRHMHKTLSALLQEIPLSESRIGDVHQVRVRKNPQHLAIQSSNGEDFQVIHADRGAGGVVETVTNAEWRERVYATFRLKELPAEIFV